MRSFVVAFAALAIVACTEESPSPSPPPPPRLDATEATIVSADALDDLLLDSVLLGDEAPTGYRVTSVASTPARRIARPIASLFYAWGADVPTDCSTQDAFEDEDHDGIPAHTTTTFACPDVSGRITVTDTSDVSAGSGYRVDFDQFLVRIVRPNATERTRRIAGRITVVAKGAPPNVARGAIVVRDLATSQTLVTESNALSWTRTSKATIAYHPEAESVRGITASTFTARTPSGIHTRRWSRVTEPSLHFHSACRFGHPEVPAFDAGAAEWTDDRGDVVRITFTGCGGWTVMLNGVVIAV